MTTVATVKTYFVPAYLIAAVAFSWECAIVVRKVRQNYPTISYSGCHIFMIVPVPYFSCYAMAMFYKYAVVTWFNSMDNDFYRFMLAMSTPILAVVATAVCRHIAL